MSPHPKDTRRRPIPGPPPICPICHNPAEAKDTSYGTRHSCCGLWSWDGKPLVDAETHEARKAAHEAFDPIWQTKRIKRREAYRELARHMGLSREDCHIALMSKHQAARVPSIAQLILADLEPQPPAPQHR